MSTPKAVELRQKGTDKILTFGSVAQASDYLGRSGTYMKYMTENREENEKTEITSAWGDVYELRIVGLGYRRDAVQRDKEKKKRKNIPLEMRQKFTTQLCTTCARAVGFCSWSERLQPVEGWDAEPTKVKHQVGRGEKSKEASVMESYRVKACPLYVKDAETKDGRRAQRFILLEERRLLLELQRSNRVSETDSGNIRTGEQDI